MKKKIEDICGSDASGELTMRDVKEKLGEFFGDRLDVKVWVQPITVFTCF